MLYTRRELGKLALATLPATSLLPGATKAFGAVQAKPNSKWAGVQVAMNAPYNFGNQQMSADEILQSCLQLGVSAVELRAQPVEVFAGARSELIFPPPAGRRGGPPPTPEQEAARKAGAAELVKWRLSAPTSKLREFHKKYEDAGVLIEIVKFDAIYSRSDDELDYCFTLAKTLGARAISCEISVADTKRLGQFADKHRLMVGYHGHASTTPAHWEEAFSYAKYNGANLDIGHFVGGNKTSPVPFLKQHHSRITHIHVKDKTLDDKNVPFGQGDTPIKEVLQVIRDNKWPIQATIEFEYAVPPGSTRMTEIGKCVEYCKQCLVSSVAV